MSIRYLAETKDYKVYSIFESVYLKNKSTCRNLVEHEEEDQCIAWIYGDPDSAVISCDGSFIVVAGCGITIFYIETNQATELFNEPDDITWTEGIYQSSEDDCKYVRFNALTKKDNLKIHRLDTQKGSLEVLS
ncbi:hypothetical protein ACJJI5_19190 [Microbulbifer sp. EKSA008]|uniref:hypothetical protein n=1 Tax=unclassified Microbulbifer TaxID=2619833 RepID=UPI0039B38797